MRRQRLGILREFVREIYVEEWRRLRKFTVDRSVIGDALPNVQARTVERVNSQERGSPENRMALWAGIQNGKWTALLHDRMEE